MDDLYNNLDIGSKGIKCGHININGLANKIHEVRTLLEKTKFDILAITETHLSEDVDDTEISVIGYDILRQDRKNQSNSWGGCAIYYKLHMGLYELPRDKNIEQTESIWAEVTVRSQKLLIACVYRHPKQKNFLKYFSPILEKFATRTNIILLGDFNIDLKKEFSLKNDFIRLISRFNLTNLIKQYTRITENSKSLIDLAITANESKVLKSGSYAAAISDHNLVYITYNLFIDKSRPVLKTVRNYKNVDNISLQNDLETAPWHLISLFDDVDDSLWFWENLLTSIIKDHVKERKVKINSQTQPWMTGNIRKEMNHRHKLLKRAQKTTKGSPEWKAYKNARNTCANIIKSAKAKYWRNEFGKVNSTRAFWSTVKSFKGKSTCSVVGPLLDQEGNLITDNKCKAEQMNKFFANVGKNLATDLHQEHNNVLKDPNESIFRVTPTLSKINLDYDLFQKSFKATVKPNKACGKDSLSATDLYLNQNVSTNGLYRVFEKSVATGKFPSSWKVAKVCSIYKNGCKRDCSNYRPISLLSIPSKVVEHFVCSQIKDHLISHNIQSEHQWGFRQNRSTEDLLLYLTETWRSALDNNKVIGILFSDFKKAFDSLSHEVLFKKLAAAGISGDFYDYLVSYLSDRYQYSVVNGEESETLHVEFGVPQGSILGPTCFTTNIDDMPQETDCNMELFADDPTAFKIGDSVDQVLGDLQISVNNIRSYAIKNYLTIHPDKCKILVLSRQPFMGPLPAVKLNDKAIKIDSESKCLGVTVDHQLSWEPHVKKVCKSSMQN